MNKYIVIAVLFLLISTKKNKGSVVVHNWDNDGYPMPINTNTLLYKQWLNTEYFEMYNGNYLDYLNANGGYRQNKVVQGIKHLII